MESFLISQEIHIQFTNWLDQLSLNQSAALGCNDPDIRKALIEATLNAFPHRQHVLLDLSETRVTDLAHELCHKVGLPSELQPDVMIHVIHLEHSLLESIPSEGYADQWGKNLRSAFSAPIYLYGDERLVKSLQQQPDHPSIHPVLLIESGDSRLPYTALQNLASLATTEPFQVADLLAMSGAIAHAEHWYQQQEIRGGHDLERLIGLAELSIHRGAYDSASQFLAEIRSMKPEESNSDIMARCTLANGRLAFASRHWKEAIAALRTGLTYISAEDSREEYGEINRMIGSAWERKGDPDKAIDHYLLAASTWAKDIRFATAAAKAFQHAGAICQNRFRYVEAKAHFSSALPLAESAGDQFLTSSLEDSIDSMSEQLQKKEKKGGKGLFGKLFS